MTKKENAGTAPVENNAEISDTKVEVATEVDSHKENINPKFKGKKLNKKEMPDFVKNIPEHQVAIALLIKNNAEIRRFTALGILNWLLQKGEIKGENRYVSFKWNKFVVKCNGLVKEYYYTEPFFLNALVASFASFSASAQKTIDTFCKKEMGIKITKAVDNDDVEEIVALNEAHVNESVKTDSE